MRLGCGEMRVVEQVDELPPRGIGQPVGGRRARPLMKMCDSWRESTSTTWSACSFCNRPRRIVNCDLSYCELPDAFKPARPPTEWAIHGRALSNLDRQFRLVIEHQDSIERAIRF